MRALVMTVVLRRVRNCLCFIIIQELLIFDLEISGVVVNALALRPQRSWVRIPAL